MSESEANQAMITHNVDQLTGWVNEVAHDLAEVPDNVANGTALGIVIAMSPMEMAGIVVATLLRERDRIRQGVK